MSYMRYIVVGVEIALSVGVDQPHAFAADEVEWFIVKEGGVLSESSEAALQQCLCAHGVWFFKLA
jgi:hypothetical protein